MFRNPATDLIVVLIIVLLILGPKRLPGLGKGLGQGMREFKEGITGSSKDEEEQQPAITPTASTPEPARTPDPSTPRPRIAGPPRSVQSETRSHAPGVGSGASARRATGAASELSDGQGSAAGQPRGLA